MRLSPLTDFDPTSEPERLRQVAGTLISPDQYYAAVIPAGAAPNDGEARLLIRDDAFGEEVMQTELDYEWPRQIIWGGGLSDPVDAVMLTSDGWLLFLRGGLMKLEKIPGVGNFTEAEGDYGDAATIAVHNGDLWMAGSYGRVMRRVQPERWEVIHLQDSRDSPKIFLSGLAIRGTGDLVAVGYRNGDQLTGALIRGDRTIDLGGRSLSDAATQFDDFWVCGNGRLFRLGMDGETVAHQTPPEVTALGAIGVHGARVFVSGEGPQLWEAIDDGLVRADPVSGAPELAISGFDTTPAGLVAQGENGFAFFDGGGWQRIISPW